MLVNKDTPYDAISRLLEDAEIKQKEWLQSRGWKYTSSTNPAHLWLFEKKMPDGRVCLLQASAAISIQEALEYTPPLVKG